MTKSTKLFTRDSIEEKQESVGSSSSHDYSSTNNEEFSKNQKNNYKNQNYYISPRNHKQECISKRKMNIMTNINQYTYLKFVFFSSLTSNYYSRKYCPSSQSYNISPSFHDSTNTKYYDCDLLQNLDEQQGNCKENPIYLESSSE